MIVPRLPRKNPDALFAEAIWSKWDICRLFRKGPKTIDKYIFHPDPKRRLPGMIVNGEFCAEKTKVLRFFAFRPDRDDVSEQQIESREFELIKSLLTVPKRKEVSR